MFYGPTGSVISSCMGDVARRVPIFVYNEVGISKYLIKQLVVKDLI